MPTHECSNTQHVLDISRILEFIINQPIINSHPIRSQVLGELSVHGSGLDKGAEVLLAGVVVHVNPKGRKEFFWGPLGANSVNVLLLVRGSVF